MGKKPENKNMAIKNRPIQNNPGNIKNRMKRAEVYGRYLLQKKSQKKERRLKREKEAQALGEDVNHTKQTPRTLDNTREREETMVTPNDSEVLADEREDEFAPYFNDEKRPKMLITTRPSPSRKLFSFIQAVIDLFPQTYYYPRKSYSIKDICFFATNRDFTHVIVVSEKAKSVNSMLISHLPYGPTAYFKVSNFTSANDIPFTGQPTSHIPELNLHGFGTRLGHRVGRFLGGMFPHNAELQGRQIVTFHNQRDFIFVRHHRYMFAEGKEAIKDSKKKKTVAKLQELGPRFTLKMRWLQVGTFDSQFGEYEWFHKRKEMDVTRRKFHL